MPNTILAYLEDTHCFQSKAQVLSLGELEDGLKYVLLDATIFYPQGGGQPCDTGTITKGDAVFTVKSVVFKEGIVYHIGQFLQGTFNGEEVVSLNVDKDRRLLNARLHSAGHLIDCAVSNIGLNWVPAKGYHFPCGPYVEYAGLAEPDKREQIRQEIEAEANRMIKEGSPVITRFAAREELKDLCAHVPDYVAEGKPARVVTMCGTGCPCGGTHVKNLAEIAGIKITKIKCKGANSRVSYLLN